MQKNTSSAVDVDPLKALTSTTTAAAASAVTPSSSSSSMNGRGSIISPLPVSPSSSFSVHHSSSSSSLASPSFSTSSSSSSFFADDPDVINPDRDREARLEQRRRAAVAQPPLHANASSNTNARTAASGPIRSANGTSGGIVDPLSAMSSSSSSTSSILSASTHNLPVYLPLTNYHNVPDALSKELIDDWNGHGAIPGEKTVMKIEHVFYFRDPDAVVAPHQTQQALIMQHKPLPIVTANSENALQGAQAAQAAAVQASGSQAHDKSAVFGTFVMTLYQVFLVPAIESTNVRSGDDTCITGIVASPLATIERLEIERPKGRFHILALTCKDGRLLKFGFGSADTCKRAHDCLMQYVFTAKEDYLFAFYNKVRQPIAPEFNGWFLYNPLAEYRRMGLPNSGLRLTYANRNYRMSTSYPNVLCVPTDRYFTDADLEAVAKFRSRGRVPACTWQHPQGRQTIWRCSQPRVGVNGARCFEDEKMIMCISLATGVKDVAIFDCRPKMNAQANKLAGKGFESAENYKNCRIFFMNIENIHVMRDSYQRLIRACQLDSHSSSFASSVQASNWLFHISEVLKATFQMVLAIDRDKVSILSHCSDGWDRTSQLVSLTELCLDPYYRTIRGFCVLIEKDWLSFGHQFGKRTGHGDAKFADQQRSPIFLQWCDTVYQLTLQFPRHFEFNSHFLVTIVHHLYSCRFGTFLHNTEMMRRKTKTAQRTVSLWTYLLCSPAACAGEFTNPLYAPSGTGMGIAIGDLDLFKKPLGVCGAPVTSASATATAAPVAVAESTPATIEANASPSSFTAPANSTDASASASSDASTATTTTMDAGAKSDADAADASVSGDDKSTSDATASTAVESAADASTASTTDGAEPDAAPAAATSTPAAAVTSTPAAAPVATPAPVEEEPEIRHSSVGRGGGDGSHECLQGSVLYPSHSMKKIQLWNDYFLRWHSDQAEHASAFGPVGVGSVAPYGASTTHFMSNDSLYLKYIRGAMDERKETRTMIAQAATRMAQLEAEVEALKAKLREHGIEPHVSLPPIQPVNVPRNLTVPPQPVVAVPSSASSASSASSLKPPTIVYEIDMSSLLTAQQDLEDVDLDRVEEEDKEEDRAAD